MKPERRYRNKITAITKKLGIYYWPINDNYTAGVPDHWYSGTADCLWVEYKYYPADKQSFDLTATKNPKLTLRQQHWLNNRYDEGRNVWVIVGMPSGGVILTGKQWMHSVKVNNVLTPKEIAHEINKFVMVAGVSTPRASA